MRFYESLINKCKRVWQIGFQMHMIKKYSVILKLKEGVNWVFLINYY